MTGNIGKQVFYLKIEKKQGEIFDISIAKGTLLGTDISTTGYLMCRVLPQEPLGATVMMIENSHVFIAKKDMEEHYARVKPLIEEGEKLAGETKKKIDALREEVLGPPVHLALAQQIINAGGKR